MKSKTEIYDRICQTLTEYEQEKKNPFTAMAYSNKFYSLLVDIQNAWEDTITAQEQPTETITEKRFRILLDKAYNSNDWSNIYEIIKKEQEPNNERICYHEMPLSNIAIEYLSELAHDNAMEDISYEDYLTDDQAEVYRLALSI
ncbi:MAG TPA: hypothetical protein PLA45_02370 [Candidatus Dojkabacteria bacterium]|nr:hypothetical protein [Candidatus Dojkabacteria bacterium]